VEILAAKNPKGALVRPLRFGNTPLEIPKTCATYPYEKIDRSQIKPPCLRPQLKKKGAAITRTFSIQRFSGQAIKFVNAVAKPAEKAYHIPTSTSAGPKVFHTVTHDAGRLDAEDLLWPNV